MTALGDLSVGVLGFLLLLAPLVGPQGAHAQPRVGLTIVNLTDITVRATSICLGSRDVAVLRPQNTLFRETPATARLCLVTITSLGPSPTSRTIQVGAHGMAVLILEARVGRGFILEVVGVRR